MKKFLVVVAVLAIVCVGLDAFALDVTVSGQAAVRSRLFENTATLANSHVDATNDAYTQTNFILEVNVKGEGVKAKLALWNDYDTWGQRNIGSNPGVDNQKGYAVTAGSNNGSTAYIREAWIDFMVPGTPIGVKAGRQLMMLGNGWFFRSNYGGSDAWVVYANLGKVATIALQDVKLSEGVTTVSRDDVDLYSLVATVKPADVITLGVDISYLNDKVGNVLQSVAGTKGSAWLWNGGVNATVKAGKATIKAEFDAQTGKAQNNGVGGVDYDGFQGVIQATIPVGIVTINAGGVYSSGNRPGSSNWGQMVTFGDAGQHYTLIYEYRTRSAGTTLAGASNGSNNLFQNTMAVYGGAMVQVAKSVAVGADVWWLNATEMVNMTTGGASKKSHDLGFEADAKLNWQITPNLSWNWQAGWLMTGSAYRTAGGFMDDIYCVQGVLALKF